MVLDVGRRPASRPGRFTYSKTGRVQELVWVLEERKILAPAGIRTRTSMLSSPQVVVTPTELHYFDWNEYRLLITKQASEACVTTRGQSEIIKWPHKNVHKHWTRL